MCKVFNFKGVDLSVKNNGIKLVKPQKNPEPYEVFSSKDPVNVVVMEKRVLKPKNHADINF